MQLAIGRRRSKALAFWAAFVLAVPAISSAQSNDPFIGTWKLDAAKSTFKPGPPAKSARLTIEAAGQAMKVTVDAVAADAPDGKWSYTVMPDGKDVPVTGHPALETANLTQVNPNERVVVYKSGGKPVMTSKAVVAKDGKTMTITQDGTFDKQTMHNVLHYVKQ